MTRRQRGFTLIELMIVIAILGVLTAMALPAYKDYSIKSRWSANLAELDGVKAAMRYCMYENANDGTQCDTAGELAAFGFPGSVLPTPTHSDGNPIVLTGTAGGGTTGKVNIAFTGSASAKSLKYNADCQMDTGGNVRCSATGTDTLVGYVKGTGR